MGFKKVHETNWFDFFHQNLGITKTTRYYDELDVLKKETVMYVENLSTTTELEVKFIQK